jgi:hypothetical protein
MNDDDVLWPPSYRPLMSYSPATRAGNNGRFRSKTGRWRQSLLRGGGLTDSRVLPGAKSDARGQPRA